MAAEDDALRPDSPYGVSKLAADVLCTAFARAFGLDVVTARPFSIVGPGKTGDVVFDIVQAIVAAEAGGPRTVPIGDVSSVRDFVPVADAVSALMTIAASGASGAAYNICTGVPRTVRWVVGQLCERALVEVTSVPSPERMRPADTPFLVGDPQRLTELGWRPGQALEDCLSETLRYWRQIAP